MAEKVIPVGARRVPLKLSRKGKDTLLRDYNYYIERVKAHGGRVLSMVLACGCPNIEVEVPRKAGEQWDSLSTCPHCGALSMHIKTRDSVRSVVPQGEELDA